MPRSKRNIGELIAECERLKLRWFVCKNSDDKPILQYRYWAQVFDPKEPVGPGPGFAPYASAANHITAEGALEKVLGMHARGFKRRAAKREKK